MSNAYIITIGDELLNGNTLDSNSTWLSKKLTLLGVKIIEKISIQDDINIIKNCVNNVLEKDCEFLFITGGLGPTHDDITKAAIKEVTSSKLEFDQEYYSELKLKFKNKGIKFLENNKTQAFTLSNCIKIKNPIGTALGINFVLNGTKAFVFPGVPKEMKEMFEKNVVPKYFNDDNKIINNITLLTSGLHESFIYNEIEDLVLNFSKFVKVAFLPKFTGVNIRLSLLNHNTDIKKMFDLKKKIRTKLGNNIYGYDNDTLEQKLGELLLIKNINIALAESCTGGLLSKLITDVPGSSKYYYGSTIAYKDDVKIKHLKVSKESINKYGAVSKQVVEEMAIGVRQKFKSDFGFAISGISGPDGGSEKKPVGLVYMALSSNSNIISKKFNFLPDRKMHRQISANVAMNMIRKYIIENYD